MSPYWPEFINSGEVKHFPEECQWGNVEAMTEAEKQHFMAAIVLMDSGKNRQWMLK